MARTQLVATLTERPSADGAELRELADVAYLEVRADLVGELDVDWLRERFDGSLLYTLRSRDEGGRSEAGRAGRRERLAAAAERYDLVDLELRRDLHDDLLDAVPESKRLLSWHGPGTHRTALRQLAAELTATPARFYKLIPEVREAGDGLRVLALLRELGREDFVAFSTGLAGTWTRLLAPRLGSPLTYGSLGEAPGAPGQLSLESLVDDYGLPALPAAGHLFGIVGRPVLHSLSPRLHNGAYRAMGVPALYVPFHAESFGDFWIEIVESGAFGELGLPLQGLSVTAPFKEVALAVAGATSPQAEHVGAANTLVQHGEVWEAETTDPEGVRRALAGRRIELGGQPAAVLGCGGAGRAAACGLQLAGAEVTLANRGEERGRKVAQELGLPYVPLAELDPGAYSAIVHATPLGHRPEDPLPFDVDRLSGSTVVLDLVYGRQPTALLSAVRARGNAAIDGREVLLYQALQQFRLMTLRELDEGLGRRLLDLEPLGGETANGEPVGSTS